MNFDFTGHTVIVTGAAHGFGRVITLAFASRGARVWGCDLVADELQVTERLCADTRGSCVTRVVDVRDKGAVEAFVAEVCAPFDPKHASETSANSAVQKQLSAEDVDAQSRARPHAGYAQVARPSTERSVDVLVNNAGGVLGQVGRPLEEIAPADWQSIFDVNVTGAFYMSQAVAPGMKRAGRGRIINISSGAGLGISLTGIQAYASAKAAQIGLTRQLAHELGPFGITVNNIAPGFVRSNPTTERQWESYGAEGQAALLDGIALKRLGTPDDIAHGVLFFTSDYANWITGQVLSIDGGK
ncbi:MAG: SDR family NAD(P)-dependent oxidoreductase [Gemmatimonadota bacterium]